MTKKDFEIIAAIITRIKGVGKNEYKRQEIAVMFSDDSENHFPQFKSDVFLRACGVPSN